MSLRTFSHTHLTQPRARPVRGGASPMPSGQERRLQKQVVKERNTEPWRAGVAQACRRRRNMEPTYPASSPSSPALVRSGSSSTAFQVGNVFYEAAGVSGSSRHQRVGFSSIVLAVFRLAANTDIERPALSTSNLTPCSQCPKTEVRDTGKLARKTAHKPGAVLWDEPSSSDCQLRLFRPFGFHAPRLQAAMSKDPNTICWNLLEGL